MTLLLNDYVCDWCDGLVEEEWDLEEITKPIRNPMSKIKSGNYKFSVRADSTLPLDAFKFDYLDDDDDYADYLPIDESFTD